MFEFNPHRLAEKGDTAMIKKLTLIELKQLNRFKATPLHYAAQKGHTDTVKALIEKGVEVHVLDQFKNTPLHLAVRNGHLETVRYLILALNKIEKNDNLILTGDPAENLKNRYVNFPDNSGLTPLEMAAAQGNEEIVKCLCEDIFVKSYLTKSNDALRCAWENNHYPVVQYFLGYDSIANSELGKFLLNIKNAETKTKECLFQFPSPEKILPAAILNNLPFSKHDTTPNFSRQRSASSPSDINKTIATSPPKGSPPKCLSKDSEALDFKQKSKLSRFKNT